MFLSAKTTQDNSRQLKTTQDNSRQLKTTQTTFSHTPDNPRQPKPHSHTRQTTQDNPRQPKTTQDNPNHIVTHARQLQTTQDSPRQPKPHSHTQRQATLMQTIAKLNHLLKQPQIPAQPLVQFCLYHSINII